MYRNYLKRILDFVIALFGLIILSPILAVLSILIKLDSKGPVLYNQERIGLNGKVFKIHKFRSMCIGAEKSGVYSDKKDTRVTRVGRFIRATSLDELPQLWNMLVGEMALIGPRPPLTYHPWKYEEYTYEQKRMFEVRPGMTGWAQINGRKDVEWNRRIELNVWYVDHLSALLDLKIFFITIIKVISNADNENKSETTVSQHEKTLDSEVVLK